MVLLILDFLNLLLGMNYKWLLNLVYFLIDHLVGFIHFYSSGISFFMLSNFKSVLPFIPLKVC